jgi:hypothetical protein
LIAAFVALGSNLAGSWGNAVDAPTPAVSAFHVATLDGSRLLVGSAVDSLGKRYRPRLAERDADKAEH